jgi:outer membrane protein assembly factor BamB
MAFDTANGSKLWETENGRQYMDGRGNGPRGTPTVDGGRVYAVSGAGDLICAQAATGKLIWQIDLLGQFDAQNTNWGLSESPLIDGDRVIVMPGADGAGVVALNKSDGSVIWKSEGVRAGYSSAVSATLAGVPQYVLLTGAAGIGVRASDGELLWRYAKVSNRTANIATPIVSGNKVFLSSDYGTGGALLEISPNGTGGAKAEEVYFSREMRNHYATSVLIDGKLYGYSSSILTCMDFATGTVDWRDRSVGKGQVITAEGLLYLQGEDGVAGLAEATPAGYREISRFTFGEPAASVSASNCTRTLCRGGSVIARSSTTRPSCRSRSLLSAGSSAKLRTLACSSPVSADPPMLSTAQLASPAEPTL